MDNPLAGENARNARLLRRHTSRNAPLAFDEVDALIPVFTACTASTAVEFQQLLCALAENAMVQELTRSLHPVDT